MSQWQYSLGQTEELPARWPFHWPSLRQLEPLVGRKVLARGVTWNGFKVEIEARLEGLIECPQKIVMVGHSPNLENVFSVQDLKTGKVITCNKR